MYAETISIQQQQLKHTPTSQTRKRYWLRQHFKRPLLLAAQLQLLLLAAAASYEYMYVHELATQSGSVQQQIIFNYIAFVMLMLWHFVCMKKDTKKAQNRSEVEFHFSFNLNYNQITWNQLQFISILIFSLVDKMLYGTREAF